MTRAALISFVVLASATRLAAQPAATTCVFDEDKLYTMSNVKLVALLQNAPRTKVTLSIDGKSGFHREIVWDPAVGDGLKHDLLLPEDTYTVLAYAEDDRVQTNSLVMTKTTQFKSCRDDEIAPRLLRSMLDRELAFPEVANNKGLESAIRIRLAMAEARAKSSKKPLEPARPKDPCPEPDGAKSHEGCRDYIDGEGLLVSTQRTALYTSTMVNAAGTAGARACPVLYDDPANSWRPKIRVLCEPNGALELAKVPLATKQLYAASIARGFLDQTAPAVVTDTLTILAEIAMDRAKAGAMELVKERFVAPICDRLDLELLGLGNTGERALPRTCALLENMRLQDLLSSGRNLLEAARDDLRLTLVPRIVTRLDVPAAAQDIAVLALELGNQLIDGGSNVSGIDLLFTQLDRLFRRGTVGSFAIVNQQFVRETLTKLKNELGSEDYGRLKDELLREILQRVLPQDPGEWLSSHVRRTQSELSLAKKLQLDQVSECGRPKDEDRYFVPADRTQCITKLIAHFHGLLDWSATEELFESIYGTLPSEQLVGMVSAAGAKRLVAFTRLPEWLEAYATDHDKLGELAKLAASPLLQRGCAVRVTLAVVKWCSGRDTCTASDIGSALDHPETLFGPAKNDALENLCWDQPRGGVPSLHLPTIRAPYIELATRAIGFLAPPAKGEERKRIEAMLHWTFDLAKTLDDNRASSVQKLEEILTLFEKRDYVRAIGQTLALARCSDTLPTASCSRSKEMKKAMELLGVVASYMQVYDETKSSDLAEAKEARKKALETLIDSATDRRERGRDVILSLGSNVGFSSTWSTEQSHQFALRVPLSLSLQYLPSGSGVAGFRSFWGLHVGVQVADLGQFILPKGEGDVTWSSFVAPGLEVGFLFGQPNRTFALTGHISYAPTLTDDSKPAWRGGISLSYYVPFFDLN